MSTKREDKLSHSRQVYAHSVQQTVDILYIKTAVTAFLLLLMSWFSGCNLGWLLAVMPVGNVKRWMSQSTTPACIICFLNFKFGCAGGLEVGSISMSLLCYRLDWSALQNWYSRKKMQQHVTGWLIKTINTLAFSLAHDSYLAAIQQHIPVFLTPGGICSWIVCNSLYVACLSRSWQAHMYMWWETKVTYKQMPLFGMEECAHSWQLTGAH